jgi:hypothetical protein
MSADPPDEPFAFPVDDVELESVFGAGSPAEICAAVLTEARIVLPEVVTALDGELWGSDIVAALQSARIPAATAAAAAERSGTPEALAMLRVLGAVGPAGLGEEAAAAAGRLAAQGISEPGWAAALGSPAVGECWRYGDALGAHEAVTMSFRYGREAHVVSVLIDYAEGGAIRDIWVGAMADVLARTRALSAADPGMTFEMITPQDARVRMHRAIAAGECPRQPEEISNVASRWAIRRARVGQLPAQARGRPPRGR